MAALQRGERVVRGLGHYDLNDTFALTGRPWWNLSCSSDILDVSHGQMDDNKIEGESDSQQLDRDLFPEFGGGAAASVDSRGSNGGVQQTDGGALVDKGGQAGAGQGKRGEDARGANTSNPAQAHHTLIAREHPVAGYTPWLRSISSWQHRAKQLSLARLPG